MDYPKQTVQGRTAPGGSLSKFSFNTLRGRFLLVLFGVLLPSLTLFGVLHHDLVKRSLLEEVDSGLANQVRVVESLLRSSATQSEADFSNFKLANAPLALESAPEVYIDIVDEQGETLWTSENLEGNAIPVPRTQVGLVTVSTPEGLHVRTLNQPYLLPNGGTIYIVVAESLHHLEVALQASIGRSVLLGLLILGLTELVGSWALRGVFKPLEHLVETAERIVITDDVAQRVPIEIDTQQEIRRTAQAFNLLMDRVEQLLEIAKRLLADTSHELRNPLTVLLADLDLLRQELSTEQREEVVDEAQATVRRMARLVSDLLLLSRAEAHSERATCEEVEVQAFVTKIVSRMAASVPGADRLSVQKSSEEFMGLLNRERTEQIVTNLVENAVRYTCDARVDVSVASVGNEIIVSVRDFGQGIPAHEHDNVFERFYRLDRSRNRHSGGTGLGLALARALARDQDGDITLESKVGEGAKFSLHIPKAPAQSVSRRE